MRSIITVTDDDKNIHTLLLRNRPKGSGYYVVEHYSNGHNCSSVFSSPDQALRDHIDGVVNANCAKRLSDAPLVHQEKILDFIRTHFKKGIKGNCVAYNSYWLKHVVEEEIGDYVSNGELKGAMLQLGYTPQKKYPLSDINWHFLLRRLRN